ncbi:MAG: pteridine reductase [Halioglobus sp.]|nr:pteridine reductase [Halioglobus sp.]
MGIGIDRSFIGKRVLVTGASRRIGAGIVHHLHGLGMSVGIHCRHSVDEASALANQLNGLRENSATVFQADLCNIAQIETLVSAFVDWAGGLDFLINNASSFYATALGTITEDDWDELLGSNLKAPLFLIQCAAGALRSSKGSVVNLIDIHAQRPLRNHSVYGAAKAGLAMLTRSMAKDLAPDVRVNGVSPGAIVWPEDGMSDELKNTILQQIPLKRAGSPRDIAECVAYLLGAPYVTGQIVAVDGGRSIGW